MQQVLCVEKQRKKSITKLPPQAEQMTPLQQYRDLLHNSTCDRLVILAFFLMHKEQTLVKSF